MANEETTNDTSRFRLRIVAPIGASPQGARLTVTSDDFAEKLRKAFEGVSVELDDTLGSPGKRTFKVAPRALSDLTLAGVVKADPMLTALLEHSKKSPRAGADAWLDGLAAIVGEGALVADCRALLAPPKPVDPKTNGASPSIEGDAVDAIFAKAEAGVSKPTSASALDKFVGAMRKSGGGSAVSGTGSASTDSARLVRDRLEKAIYGTARAVLADPTVARMEIGWRSVKWVVENAPASSGVRLEILDAPASDALSLLRSIPEDGDFEDPDLFAVTQPIDDVEVLKALAELAEERLAPMLATITPARDPDALLHWLETEQTLEPLRAEESSRWLGLAYNDPVLFHEGSGEASRTVLGSPVWALVASLASAFTATGAFARIAGQTGQLKAPGTITITGGRDEGTAIPTKHFASIRAQSELEKRGVLLLGSPRNSDKIALSGAPMMRASGDAVPLPAQMWAGRIARFASWVRAQLPPGASSDEAREIFEQAASVFLYPGSGRSAKVTAEIVENAGKRTLQVGARIHGSAAMIPLDLEFGLPLA